MVTDLICSCIACACRSSLPILLHHITIWTRFPLSFSIPDHVRNFHQAPSTVHCIAFLTTWAQGLWFKTVLQCTAWDCLGWDVFDSFHFSVQAIILYCIAFFLAQKRNLRYQLFYLLLLYSLDGSKKCQILQKAVLTFHMLWRRGRGPVVAHRQQ